MTTAQAVSIEILLQYLTAIFLSAVVIVSGPIVNSVSAGGIAAPVGTAPLSSQSSSMLVMGVTQLSAVHSALFTSASYPLHSISSPTPGVSLVLQYAYGNRHSHYAASAEHSSGIHSARNLATTIKYPPEIVEPLQRLTRRYSFVVILGVFILAFVIAAGVEETLKHFIVRCCPFTRPLKDPSAVLGMTHSITVKFSLYSAIISTSIVFKFCVSIFFIYMQFHWLLAFTVYVPWSISRGRCLGLRNLREHSVRFHKWSPRWPNVLRVRTDQWIVRAAVTCTYAYTRYMRCAASNQPLQGQLQWQWHVSVSFCVCVCVSFGIFIAIIYIELHTLFFIFY